MVTSLQITTSPKRVSGAKDFALYPYYAGFSESFVKHVLEALKLPSGAVVFDPWNGSGTTTSAATRAGLSAIGFDLNPVMVVVATARQFPAREATSLTSLCEFLIDAADAETCDLGSAEPLRKWFKPSTAIALRSLERAIARVLVDEYAQKDIGKMSTLAATFYTALFAVARRAVFQLRSANPTWTKTPRDPSTRISVAKKELQGMLRHVITSRREELGSLSRTMGERGDHEIRVANATTASASVAVDCVLTSPPYCTRIDYAASTGVEIALLELVSGVDLDKLRGDMIGTTKVPASLIEPRDDWGNTCTTFLKNVREHPSKASAGYYYKTHVDYFDKMHRSIGCLAASLKGSAPAILIVQDSYYKELHNDVATVIQEMCSSVGLKHVNSQGFASKQCMSRVNTRAAAHQFRAGSTEHVLSFQKEA